jgi:hypothetical protein
MLFLFFLIFIIKIYKMAKNNDVYSIIVPVASANFSAHTYTQIYGGSAGCSITVNGISVNVGAASSIDIWVRTVSGGAGCYLLGENQDVYQGSTSLS